MFMNVCIYTRLYVNTYIHIHIYTYIHIYVYLCKLRAVVVAREVVEREVDVVECLCSPAVWC